MKEEFPYIERSACDRRKINLGYLGRYLSASFIDRLITKQKWNKIMRELSIWMGTFAAIYALYLWTDKSNTAQNMDDLLPAALMVIYVAAALIRIVILFIFAWLHS